MMTVSKAAIARLVFALCAAGCVGAAQAACSQGNLTGTWYALGVSGNAYYGTMSETDRCKIRVLSNGRISASGSSCIYRSSGGRETVAIGGGSLRVTSTCSVTGSVQFCAGGGCLSQTVEYGQLDLGKSVMSLVGYTTANPDTIFSLTAIKQ